MGDPLSRLQRLIESRLRLAFPDDRWHLMHGVHPMTATEFRASLGVTPLLVISLAEIKPGAGIGREWQGDVTWRLTILVKNPAQKHHRFFGDQHGPGLYPAIVAAIGVLNGATLKAAPVAGQPAPAPEATLFAGAVYQTYAEGFDDLSMAIATLDVTARVQIKGGERAADEFRELASSFTATAPLSPNGGTPPLAAVGTFTAGGTLDLEEVP